MQIDVALPAGVEPRSPIRSPRCLADVTAPYLSEVLRSQYPGVAVETCQTGQEIWGSAVKVRLHVAYNARGRELGLPETLILKAGLGSNPIEMEAPSNYPELFAYQTIVPQLSVNAPKIFYAGMDADGFTLLLMEDLIARGARFCHVLSALGREQAAAFLDEFAAIHARWWDSPELRAGGALSFVPDTLEDSGGVGAIVFFRRFLEDDYWSDVRSWPRVHTVPPRYRDRDQMRAGILKLQEVWRQMPHCLLHGDEHLSNLFIDADGRPGMIDWQCKKAPWAEAFAYFVVGSLEIADRRAWEVDLLKTYLARLRQLGVDAPGFDEAFLAYRQAILFGLMVWLSCPPNIQSEVNCVAVSTRFGAAALDHDVMGALGL